MKFKKGDKVTIKAEFNHLPFGNAELTVDSYSKARHPGAVPYITCKELLSDFPNYQLLATNFELVEEPETMSEVDARTTRADRKRNIYEAMELMEHYDIRRVQNGKGECGYFIGGHGPGSNRYESIEQLIESLVPDNTQAIASKREEIEQLKAYIENKQHLIKAMLVKSTVGSDRLGVLEQDLEAMIDVNR